MVETVSTITPTDLDIAADIDEVILHYPPLAHDRNHLSITVLGGAATIRGYLRTINSYDYLLQALQAIDGLKSVNVDYLHIDENLRLALGRVIPLGVIANVEYGTVVLSGELPEGETVDELVARVGSVPGVRRVVIALRD